MTEARFQRPPHPDDFLLEWDRNANFFVRFTLWITTNNITNFDGNRWFPDGGREVHRKSGHPDVGGDLQMQGVFDRTDQSPSQVLTPHLQITALRNLSVVGSVQSDQFEWPGGDAYPWQFFAAVPVCDELRIGFVVPSNQDTWPNTGTQGSVRFLVTV